MKHLRYFLIFIFLCEISYEAKCSRILSINLNNWTMSNENRTIQMKDLISPIGVYSALRKKYGSVLNSKNDDNLKWIAYDNWTFTTNFSVTFGTDQRINLTLHGVDTVSILYLNDHEVGRTDNMFIRYSFDLLPYIERENILEIKLISPILAGKERAEELWSKGFNAPPNCPDKRMHGECYRNMLRKMQANYGGIGSAAVLSMGLWKPVQLEYYEVAILRDVDVAIRNNETHWTLDMRLFLSSDTQQMFNCEVTFIAVELLDNPLIFNRTISPNSLQVEFKVDLPKEKVELWWPNGYGNQKLYPVYFATNCWQNAAGPRLGSRTKSQKNIDIGFRTIELVENLDDFGRTFYFKVNKQPIFVKGANFVPSNILPEYSYKESRLQHLLQSAKETHLNMLRVWGGGLYESDIFYNLTDFYGLLVWQDLAFTESTYPLMLRESVLKETSQNARRIAYHPSFCMFVANDEIELFLTRNKSDLGWDSERLEGEYKQMFKSSIRSELNVVSRNDFNPRAGPMISTPSNGIAADAEISMDPQNLNFGDVHFMDDHKDGWDPDIYPRARFISKYGFQSLPILSSWNRTLYPDDNLESIVDYRQHDPRGFSPITELITKQFPIVDPLELRKNLKQMIYLSQLTQAMAVKTATDVFRSHRSHKRTMGAIYWHLNDNYVASSPSSIDFFGNYKIVWNWSKEFMAPTVIIALMDAKNSKINVTVTTEGIVRGIENSEKFNITMFTYLWSELYHRRAITWEISMSPNGIYTDYLDMNALFKQPFNTTNCFLKFILFQNNETISSTYLFPEKISKTNGLANPQLNYGLTSEYCLQKPMNVNFQYHSITILVKRPALFVYFEVHHPNITKYKLSENGFIITEPIKVVQLQTEYQSTICSTLTKEHITVMTANELFYDTTPANSPNNSINSEAPPITVNTTASNSTEKYIQLKESDAEVLLEAV